ncbi:MAG: Gfo/Idh/MocA family oxidoreductase, partial [Clostridia bacterium]
PVMKKALEHCKHILCEKPITIKPEDALEINALAEESGLKIAVNYQYRYDANCHRLAKAVMNGDLGRILFIRCLMPWSRDESYFTKSPWHASLEKSGGGTLITQGSHLLDIILWMTGCGVKSAEAVCRQLKFRETEVEDFCSAEIVLENGTPVQFTCTMAVPVEKEIRLEVFGENGYGVYTKLKSSGVKFYGARPPKYGYGRPAVHAVQKSLRDFRDSILSGKEHLCPGSEAVRVLEAVNFIYSKAKGEKSEGI